MWRDSLLPYMLTLLAVAATFAVVGILQSTLVLPVDRSS
jgi:hypothetical protein